MQKPLQNQPTNLDFRTADIGTKTAKYEDAFDEQKQQLAAEQSRASKRHRLAYRITIIALGIIAALLVVAALIWFLIIINTPPATSENHYDGGIEYSDIQAEAQTIYETQGLDALNQFFTDQLANADPADPTAKNRLLLAQLATYSANQLYDNAHQLILTIDPSTLTLEQLTNFCGIAYNTYATLGDTEEAEYYRELSRETVPEDETVEGRG